MSAKKKYYVVWKGHIPGIYTDWNEAEKQVKGFDGAAFKSFSTEAEAREAYSGNGGFKATPKKIIQFDRVGWPLSQSIAVDAACSGNPGKMEYRGVITVSGKELFRQGPFDQGTNNIGEFLAIVHALAYFKKMNSFVSIYTDSVNAMKWVNQKEARTKLEPVPENLRVFEMIARAETWLHKNSWNNKILKWNTQLWGEIPADFGRK
ncbi:MAG: ribonuclease H family protein [Bacteroidales bacterium]|nr:ribonuclease H family protein [Bacteroidales bacterium]